MSTSPACGRRRSGRSNATACTRRPSTCAFVLAPGALVALQVDGEDLDLDHGYPARIVIPNQPGVRQTKWLSRIEVA